MFVFFSHIMTAGLFAELGAALTLAQKDGKPKIFALADEIPEAMFHYHSATQWKKILMRYLSNSTDNTPRILLLICYSIGHYRGVA